MADALSTAFMIQAPAEIAACCRSRPGLEAWVFENELVYFFNTPPIRGE